MASAITFKFSVYSISLIDGVVSPDGWLCITTTAGAFIFIAYLNISFGS